MGIDGFKVKTGSQRFALAVSDELPGLYRYAHSITGNEAEAEDLVGETIVRALERGSQYRGEASLRTWLHHVLHNLAIDRVRHHAHELDVEEVETLWHDDSYSVDPTVVAERVESIEELHEALIHLPYHYRSAVVLHDAEGFSANEIAAILDISVPAVKQRIRRGRMMLVSALSQQKERQIANTGIPLNCWDAREQVSSYIDDELDPLQRSVLESHLAGCATCPPLYQSLVGTTASLGLLHDPDSVIPDTLAHQVRHYLKTEEPEQEIDDQGIGPSRKE